MHETQLPESPVAGLRTLELGPAEAPLLQRFFDANPLYFEVVGGEPTPPNAGVEEIHQSAPDGWPFTKKWLIGYADSHGALQAMATVISDLLAPGVWHLGLFVMATARHGNGEAEAICRGLESWARGSGAEWLRLGVVKGNLRAERFWARLGFVETRTREGIVIGRLTQTLRALHKPLAGGTLDAYLQLVPRDQPGSTRER
jgi:GNAT superfamily N-acetyltransferase